MQINNNPTLAAPSSKPVEKNIKIIVSKKVNPNIVILLPGNTAIRITV
jgi:hypothetical protein